MAIAVQKRLIDEHVRHLKEAGVGSPKAAYSQATALAAAAGVPDAIVVHFRAAQATIVLVRGGAPQAVHQVLIQAGADETPEQSEAVARAVQQILGYDQSAAEEGILSLPLVLTGLGAQHEQLARELQQLLGREVRFMSAPVVYPDGFPIAEYAANVGLALLHHAGVRSWLKRPAHSGAALNLLSERHMPRRVPIQAVGVFLVLALFAVTALNLAPRVEAATSDEAEATSTLEDKERQERLYNLRKIRVTKLENDVLSLHRHTLALSSNLANMRHGIDTLGGWFERIESITIASRPPNVVVSELTPEGDSFKLLGKAVAVEDAIQYAANIRDSGLFVDVSVRELYKGGSARAGAGATVEELNPEDLALLAALGMVEGESPGETVTTVIDLDAGDLNVGFVIEATAKQPEEEGEEPSAE